MSNTFFSPFNFSLFSPPFFSVSRLFLPHIYQPKLNASSITHLCSFSLSNGKTQLRFNFKSSLRYRLPVAATITNVLLCNPRRCALEHTASVQLHIESPTVVKVFGVLLLNYSCHKSGCWGLTLHFLSTIYHINTCT